MKDRKNTVWTTWLFRLVIPILLFVSVYHTIQRFRDESKHQKLIELDKSITDALESGNKYKALQLLEELHHPSLKKTHGRALDSLISWNQYWEMRNKEIRNSIQNQQIRPNNRIKSSSDSLSFE